MTMPWADDEGLTPASLDRPGTEQLMLTFSVKAAAVAPRLFPVTHVALACPRRQQRVSDAEHLLLS